MMKRNRILIISVCCLIATSSIAENVSFVFYGANINVRIFNKQEFRIAATSPMNISDAWRFLAENANETLQDCLSIKKELRLNDWGYLRLLGKLSSACFGKTNEAEVIKGFLFANSGYQTSFGNIEDKIYMLYCSKDVVYNQPYFISEGDTYYCDDSISVKTLKVAHPYKGKALSFDIKELPKLPLAETPKRHLQSKKYPDIRVSVSVNKNLMDFFSDYPPTMKNYDLMTRWAILGNAPLDEYVKAQIYPMLKNELKGLSKLESVERLLNFMQTAFIYNYDEKVWGHDRAFFSEETMYYQYSDIEDRSILLSRLVRDLLGLEVVLLYYSNPGHLPIGIHFDEEVDGEYVIYNGDKFMICDPVYINAQVGKVMSLYKNEEPEKIILLYR